MVIIYSLLQPFDVISGTILESAYMQDFVKILILGLLLAASLYASLYNSGNSFQVYDYVYVGCFSVMNLFLVFIEKISIMLDLC